MISSEEKILEDLKTELESIDYNIIPNKFSNNVIDSIESKLSEIENENIMQLYKKIEESGLLGLISVYNNLHEKKIELDPDSSFFDENAESLMIILNDGKTENYTSIAIFVQKNNQLIVYDNVKNGETNSSIYTDIKKAYAGLTKILK